MAKWVAEFVLREAFADIAGSGRAENFGEALFFDVAERNLSAMVEATGDNATVMENGYMRIERAACAGNDFASLVFALRARLLGSVIQISVLICATLASFVFRLSSIL